MVKHRFTIIVSSGLAIQLLRNMPNSLEGNGDTVFRTAILSLELLYCITPRVTIYITL